MEAGVVELHSELLVNLHKRGFYNEMNLSIYIYIYIYTLNLSLYRYNINTN